MLPEYVKLLQADSKYYALVGDMLRDICKDDNLPTKLAVARIDKCRQDTLTWQANLSKTDPEYNDRFNILEGFLKFFDIVEVIVQIDED
jgi:hypothetical protein